MRCASRYFQRRDAQVWTDLVTMAYTVILWAVRIFLMRPTTGLYHRTSNSAGITWRGATEVISSIRGEKQEHSHRNAILKISRGLGASRSGGGWTKNRAAG